MDDQKTLIRVDDWAKMVRFFGKDGVPVPFVKEIFLLESRVAGTGFVEDIEAKTAALKEGSVLTFQREPKNKHDEKAILILNEKGERIGYVPRADNAILSRLMDAGKLIYGKVKEMYTSSDWLQIEIEIYLRDW